MNFTKEFFSKDYFFGRKRSNYLNYNYWDNDRYWKSIISAIKKYKIKGKMLDIGCAFGFLLKRVVPYFNEVHGVDISSFAVQKAKEEVPSAKLKLIDINTENLPYPDKYFDLITALDVLEHTESIEDSLRKITKILHDTGYLIISVPLRDTWAGKIFSILNKDPTHISVPSRKELFDIINRIGLKILEKHYFFNVFPVMLVSYIMRGIGNFFGLCFNVEF